MPATHAAAERRSPLARPTNALARTGAGPSTSQTGTNVGLESALIDLAVSQLNALGKQATFDFAMAVGRLVIGHFYSGNLDTWRLRGAKDVSFRMLAKHPDLPLSPAALYRSVAIYELVQRLDLTRLRRVSTSHIRLVLPLRPEEQSRMLALADAEAWSVARLDGEIAALSSGETVARGGRKRTSRLRKTMKTLERCIDDADDLIGVKEDEISPETVIAMKYLLSRFIETCKRLQDRSGLQEHGYETSTTHCPPGHSEPTSDAI